MSRESFPSRWEGNRGSILVLALLVISVLTLFGVTVAYQVRGKITLAERIDLRNQLHGLAEMGIQKVINEMKKGKASEGFNNLNYSWANAQEMFHSVPLGGGSFSVAYVSRDAATGIKKVQYGVQDEESRINLNTADAKVLSRLFQMVADLEEDMADSIAYSIVDWRDSDTFMNHPDHGAEDNYYEELDLPYESKDEPFDVVDEVLLVRGMTQEIFEKAKDKITVLGAGGVNINTAPREVLSALGLSRKVVEKIFRYRAGLDGEILTADDRAFSDPNSILTELTPVVNLSASEQNEISNLASLGTLVTTSSHFLIGSRGELEHKRAVMEVKARIDNQGKILSWSTELPRRIAAKAPPKEGAGGEDLSWEVLAS